MTVDYHISSLSPKERRKLIQVSPPVRWSHELGRWLCFNSDLLDMVLSSDTFVVPDYNSIKLQDRLGFHLPLTREVIKELPIANEGKIHLYLRQKMQIDINKNAKSALDKFTRIIKVNLETINMLEGRLEIAPMVTSAILLANQELSGIDICSEIDYSDLTLILDDTQSVKNRLILENLLQHVAKEFNAEDKNYKLALLVIGVNALISTTLHSLIYLIENKKSLIDICTKRHFPVCGIKYLERVSTKDQSLNDQLIRKGDVIRLYMETYESLDVHDSEKNKKFFSSSMKHGCLGMSFSLQIWRSLLEVLTNTFSELSIVDYSYRKNDGIFNFPKSLIVDYKK